MMSITDVFVAKIQNSFLHSFDVNPSVPVRAQVGAEGHEVDRILGAARIFLAGYSLPFIASSATKVCDGVIKVKEPVMDIWLNLQVSSIVRIESAH